MMLGSMLGPQSPDPRWTVTTHGHYLTTAERPAECGGARGTGEELSWELCQLSSLSRLQHTTSSVGIMVGIFDDDPDIRYMILASCISASVK